MTATTAGLETIAWTGNLVDVPQCQALAVLTMVHHLALVSHALNLMSRLVTLLRCIAMLVMTRRDAGTATGRLRTGATWALIRTDAGWATGARTRAWEAALHPWEDQRYLLVRTSAPT